MESVTAVANIGSHTQGRRTAIYPRVRTIRRSANCTLVASAVHFATNTHRLALCARRTGNVFDKKTTLSLAFRIGGEKKKKIPKTDSSPPAVCQAPFGSRVRTSVDGNSNVSGIVSLAARRPVGAAWHGELYFIFFISASTSAGTEI